MSAMRIGILHPGEMGVSVAAAARRAGHEVCWASAGRSAATRARAERARLRDVESVSALCAGCDLVLSVCPPAAAEAVAREVAACGFRGLYLDANAVSPARAVAIGEVVTAAGAGFVDGGIIGG